MMVKRVLHPFVMSLLLAGSVTPADAAAKPMRAVQVDLDYVYDADAAQTDRNLDLLVKRIAAIRPSVVFLQAFADPQGTGLASETYFPNASLPMRADLFGRAVLALKKGTKVKVYGWLPVLSFDVADDVTRVQAWVPEGNFITHDAKAYRRVSPFDATGRKRISGLYRAMAKAAPIDGVLFHDDALLSDFEDASPAALKAYAKAGLPASVKELRASPKMLKAWTDFKVKTLIDYTHALAAEVRHHRPHALTVRNIYAPLLLDAESRNWFAQDYKKFLKAYDYVAVEAMPRLEQIDDAESLPWLGRLADAARAEHNGVQRTIFELQSVDWNLAAQGKSRAIDDAMFAAQMLYLTQRGITNFGYYPDDFVTDTPKADLLQTHFSLPTPVTAP